MLRKTLSALGAFVMLFGLLGFAPAPERRGSLEAPDVGEEDLLNFEHVYNFNLAEHTRATLNRGSTDQQGTDLEFFSTDVEVTAEDGSTVTEERDFAVLGDHSDGIALFDITDPEDVSLASYIDCPNPRSDVGVWQHDGRTFVGSSRESGAICVQAGPLTRIQSTDANPLTNENGGFSMFEVTDPYAPTPFASVRVGAGGAHNFIFHPTEPVAYAWNGEIGGAEVTTIQIVDMRPHFEDGQPVTEIFSYVGPTTLGSPHDGELSPDGSVMYVASETDYMVFDNTDPFDPQVTTTFAPNEGTYAHGFFATPDGDIGITNNESLALGGFFVGGTTVCPGEGLGFYDLSTDGVAVGPVGYFTPPVAGRGPDSRACTSHFGRTAPNNMVMSVGWYILGGRVVDFSIPSLPVEIGAATLQPTGGEFDEGTEAWSAKFYKGKPYMYVGDQGRGFDVFRWTGPEECGSPFGADWVGVDNCDGLEYRMSGVDVESAQASSLAAFNAAQQLGYLGDDDAVRQMQLACRLLFDE